ncbi:MAG TPA: HEAT repeat domain-containing protein [Gemmataceae bacterium]|nr:HEAT repeat domain-containing protein [Gemmataceae bacterium]
MKCCTTMILASVVLIVAVPDGSAQLFGSKKAKVPPQQRVPELIVALRTDKDAHKRADAAEELRQFELKDFPEIVPILIDALQTDPATNVRIEAATSLGRLRPVSAPAGLALEKAAANDADWRVRLQAKTSLVYYQLSGYHTPKKNDAPGAGSPGRTDEPPLAGPGVAGEWWKNGPPPSPKSVPVIPGPPSNIAKPLPNSPLPNPPTVLGGGSQGPVVVVPTPPPPTTTQPGPTIQLTPPVLQLPPQPQWTPVQPEGPILMPPKL